MLLHYLAKSNALPAITQQHQNRQNCSQFVNNFRERDFIIRKSSFCEEFFQQLTCSVMFNNFTVINELRFTWH